MANIPIYESRVGQEPVKMSPVSQELFTAGGQMFKETGKYLDEVASKFADLDTLRRKTKAENDLSMELADIQSKASLDPDISRTDYYQQEIEKATAKHLETVPKIAQNEVLETFRLKSYNTFAKVREDFRIRNLDATTYEALGKINTAKDDFISAGSEVERKAFQINALGIVAELRDKGVLTPQQAQSKNEEISKGWWKETATYEASTNPELYWAERHKYPLNPQDLAATDSIADRTALKQKADLKRDIDDIRAKKTEDLMVKVLSNQLSVRDIEKEMAIPESEGGVSKNTLIKFQRALLSKDIVKDANKVIRKEPEARKVFRALQKVLMEDIPVLQLREFILDALSDGKLSTEEAGVLNNVGSLIKNVNYNKETNPIRKGWMKFTSGMNKGLYGLSDKPYDEALVDLREYLRSIGKKEEPEAAMDRIIKSRQDKNYPEYSDWEEGKEYNSLIGTVKFLGRDVDGMPIVEKKK